MLICKPDWITHTDSSQTTKEKKVCIYSVHVHPNGERLATGGLDTKVRIWNTAPVLNEEAEDDPNVHKLLCTMTMHNGAVLCVRWSNTEGRYLASGSDNDNTIIIWELDRSVTRGTVFGSSDVNYESWRPVKYLRGHESDVQDLAWSSDNQYLASCAVDGHVIVWDGLTFDRVKKIDQHGGFVKGVTWDPVGKYLASQSDDNLVKIWRTSDWGLERDIREPFVNAPGTTFFRRLSWAPNGSHIAAANAVNGMQCVAAVISRDNWSSDLSLVGHELPVEVACFNPKLFYFATAESDSSAQPADEQRGSLASVCALGGQDRSISIWVTKYSRPLCVAADVFQNNIYDLAWSPDGRYVVACSQDGTVAFLQLDEELGTAIEDDEMIQLLSKYGYKRKAVTLPETPVQLELEEENATAQKAQATSRIAMLMGGDQPDTAMPDITKTNLAAISDSNASATKLTTSNEDQTKSSSTSIEKSSVQTAATSQANAEPLSQPKIDVAKQQKVTIGKDGKKRIQPVFFNTRNNNPNGTDTSNLQNNDDFRGGSDIPLNGKLNGSDYDSPADYLRKGGIPTAVVGTKRKETEEHSLQDSVKRVDIDQNSALEPLYRPSWIDSAIVPPIVRQSQLRLGVPKVKSVLTHRGDATEPSWVLECQNSSNRDHSKVIYCHKGAPIWVDYVPSSVLQMTGNKNFCAVGCEDGSVVVYSSAGRRLLPPLMLESTPVWMSCSDGWLLALTATGLLYIWDIIHETSFLSEISIAPVLQVATVVPTADYTSQPAPTIKDIRIQRNGTPIIITNHNQAFAYHLKMKVWTRICDAWQMLSELWGSGTQNLDANKHPLGWLSRATTTVGHKASSIGHHAKTLARMDHQATSIITLGHIETQLAVAILLDSPDEYRQWMINYAKRLATENATERVDELCRWLLGPTYASDADDSNSRILGTLDKRTLLKNILPILVETVAKTLPTTSSTMLACSDTDYINRTYYQHLQLEEQAEAPKEKRVCISTAKISTNHQNSRSPFVRHHSYTIDLSAQDISELMPIPLMLEASQSFKFKYILHASLSMITHLKLAYNALATLPENIGLMENLVHLDVSHNRLKSLPTSIGSLAKLSVLQARNNCLEELPQEIGQLSALSALDISQNDISFLPAEVVRLGNLCRLITTRCPFMDTAPSIRAHNPCSLREACARTIIRHHIPLQDDLPVHIRNYVLSAKECSVCAQPCYERIIYRYKLHDRGSGQTIPLRYTLCSAHWNDHDESLSSMFSTRSTHSLQHYMKDSSINTQLVPVEPASTNHRASIVRPMPIQSPQRKNTLWHKARMRLLNHDIVA